MPNSRKYLFHKTSVSIINSEQKEIFISQDFYQYHKNSIGIINSEQKEIFISQDFCQYN